MVSSGGCRHPQPTVYQTVALHLSYIANIQKIELSYWLGARSWVRTLLKYKMPNQVYISGYYPLLCGMLSFQVISLSALVLVLSLYLVRLRQNSYLLLFSFRVFAMKQILLAGIYLDGSLPLARGLPSLSFPKVYFHCPKTAYTLTDSSNF